MSEPSARAEPLRLTSVPPHTGPSDGESSATSGGACWRKGSEVREYCWPLSDTATASASAPPPDARAAATVAFARSAGAAGATQTGVASATTGASTAVVLKRHVTRGPSSKAPRKPTPLTTTRVAPPSGPDAGESAITTGGAYAEKSFGLAA